MTTYKKMKLLKTLGELLRDNQLNADRSDALQYAIDFIMKYEVKKELEDLMKLKN